MLRNHCRGTSQGDALEGFYGSQCMTPAKPVLAGFGDQHTQIVSSKASDSLVLWTSSRKPLGPHPEALVPWTGTSCTYEAWLYCAGDQFALFESIVALAILLRRYEFRMAPNAPPVGMTTVRPSSHAAALCLAHYCSPGCRMISSKRPAKHVSSACPRIS